MIDLKNFNSNKLLNSLHSAAEQSENLLNGIDMDQAKELMTPKQLRDLRQAKKDISAVRNKDFSKMNEIINKFK